MRRLLVAIVGAIAIAGCAEAALAADAPSLMGSWTGTGPSVGAGEGWETGRSFTMTVTEQRGPVFKAMSEWPGGQEEMLGVIRADGRTILLNNSDGVSMATLLGPDQMEACYVEGGDDALATCMILNRSK
ncbi:MAG: hypothetical protein AB7I59_02855 [Geminicoccaceae bacterium]